ncbi:NAD-dependent epimerase/dehydratase family protein [Rugosimonospora africana]|uniref:UDP-glucose 4-epimerase n=1 Tax=Rugosimonospora africana TaxID=556532 RepID=A0A8J3QXA3_9ACTN|nr:NAD-dependent epimerase/dehydratase family protein [Rugosimonospora africana]GIH18859.1 UDP-glucose 4-epimerase GalE [Rugosimonospora africana]
MRVLVTGGLGFIGRAVARELVSAGHRVDVLSRGTGGVEPPAGADLVEGDVRDRDRIAAVVADRRYDGICHLAGLIRGRDSIADPLSYYDVNLGGTVNLLAAVKAAGPVGQRPVRVVFASTSIVYGSQRTGALSEDLPPAPENPYGASKVAAEQLIGYHAATGEISAVTLRCFNVAGAVDGYADTDPTRIIPNVLRAVRGELPHVSVNGDGSAVREFTHVLDVASAFRLALEATGAGATGAKATGAGAGAGVGAVYNVGTGRGVSVRELIATAERVTGRRVPVEHLPPKPEPHTLVSDPRRLMTEFGWVPTHSDLDEIIGSAWS